MRVIREDNSEVQSGDLIKDFRDKTWKFKSICEGHKICVEGIEEEAGWNRVFFPTVFNLRIVE